MGRCLLDPILHSRVLGFCPDIFVLFCLLCRPIYFVSYTDLFVATDEDFTLTVYRCTAVPDTILAAALELLLLLCLSSGTAIYLRASCPGGRVAVCFIAVVCRGCPVYVWQSGGPLNKKTRHTPFTSPTRTVLFFF